MNRLHMWTLVVVAVVAAPVGAQDVVIRITGNGPAAKYIKDGATMQEDVEVTVGQTVRWINAGNMKHTATSVKKDAAGVRIFDTGDVTQTPPSNFKDFTFSEAVYTAAGGMAGGSVELEYFCARHPTLMKSKIVLKSTAPPDAAPLRVRKNIESLSADELAALRQGVAVMKSRDPADPTSWAFQANMHGVPAGGPTNPLFAKCQHGTAHFLTWHRGYLHYFERILRAASGHDDLTLPYWNWTTQPTVPLGFREADGGANSLFHPRALNNGASLPPEVVVTMVDDAQSAGLFLDFSDLLESPHGIVHSIVGGGEDMSFISTSARDPIFWLHHANVDRNWDHWLGVTDHLNPTDPAFLAKTFQYVDENGTTVTVTVAQIISSAALGYEYDDVPPLPTPAPAPEFAAAHPEHAGGAAAGAETPHGEHAAAPAGALVASSQQVGGPESTTAIKLGFAPQSLELAFREHGLETLESAAIPAADARSKVVLEVIGLTAKAPTSFAFGIYVNLPADPSAEQLQQHFVGAIDLFGVSEHGDDHPAHPQQFDITAKLRRLGLQGDAAPTDVDVTIRPITPRPAGNETVVDEAAYRASADAAEVGIERVDLRVVPVPAAPEAASRKGAAIRRPSIPKRASLPLPPRGAPGGGLESLDGPAAADPEVAIRTLVDRRAALVREMGQLDVDIARALESICGPTTDYQDVEKYDGTLGVPVQLVRDHERAVGQLQWLSDLADRFDGPNDSPGNVNGQRWGSGGMISADLFLTAGHCFDNSGAGGWDMPFRNSVVIAPDEIATLMRVNFLYQVDATTGLRRRAESFPVLELLEYREGDHDYAIVRLGPNADGELPGDKYGRLTVAAADLTQPSAMLCLIQHPNGLPKKIEAGPMQANDGIRITYATLDTLGGSSGAPIMSLEGAIVGVHTNGGCTEFGGANRGVSIGAIRGVSTLLPGGTEHAAAGGH